MFKRTKEFLMVICIVMVFTAQTYRTQQKASNAPRASASRPASQPQRKASVQAPRNQNRTAIQQPRPVGRQFNQAQNQVVQFHREQPQPAIQRTPRALPMRPAQPQPQPQAAVRQRWTESRVYAMPSTPSAPDNRTFHRHGGHWQPRYNFYDNQYHFYPYVDIAALVELDATSVMVPFDGQNYCYDDGTFYLQDQSGQYVAVPPPLGLIVSALPTDARQIEVQAQIYYRFKGVFYVQVAQGYQVVQPMVPVPADA